MAEYIAYAVPVFLVLIAAEALWAWRTRKKIYRLNDAVTDIGTGLLQQLLLLFTRGVVYGVYAWLHEHARLADIPTDSALAWVACVVGVDFFYYWFHRVSHERNLGWASHITHHQSDEYNLAVALRQGAFQPLFSWVFYLPLAVCGFPVAMFAAAYAMNVLYQFWIHTRVIGRLGPLEWVLNTPSHHRVHHASDARYIDRNYAGILIVWDRLFGTFVEEREEPTYGVTEAVRSWNPVWVNLHYIAVVFARAAESKRAWDRVRIWWMPPSWRPDETPEGRYLPLPPHDPDERPYDAAASRGAMAYAVSQLLVAVAAGTALLALDARLPGRVTAIGALLVTWTVVGCGAVMESKRWAAASEVLRWFAVAGFAVAAAIGAATPG